MRDEIRRARSERLMPEVCSIILLPLNKNKRKIETIIRSILDHITLYRPNQYFDSYVEKNILKLMNSESPEKNLNYLASYLKTLPFIKRLPFQKMFDLLKAREIEVVTL